MNGYLYVASKRYVFYKSALMSAMTLKDYYPESNITLVTHEEWVDETARSVFDNIITENVPVNERTKLWALSKTPYDKTLYIDADTEIKSEEISKVFDQLDDQHNMVMGLNKEYAHAVVKFPGGNLKWHCGIFLYDNNPETLKLMDAWWEQWNHHQEMRKNNSWDLDNDLYPKKMLWHWDTFAFWRVLNLEGYGDKIKIKEFDNFAKWNWHNYRKKDLDGNNVVIYHHTLSGDIGKRYETRNIK